MCLGLTLSEQAGAGGLGAGFWITWDFRIWLYSEQREGSKEADRRETQFTLCQVEVARVEAGNPVRRLMGHPG